LSGCNAQLFLMFSFLKFFENFSVKMLTKRLALKHKLFVDDFSAIEKFNKHAFDFRLAHSCFIVRDVKVCHFMFYSG